MTNQTKNRHLLCYAFCKSRSIINYVQLLPSKYLCSDFFYSRGKTFSKAKSGLGQETKFCLITSRSFIWDLFRLCQVWLGWASRAGTQWSGAMSPGSLTPLSSGFDSFTLKSYRWYPTQAGSRAIHGKLCGAAGAGGGGGEQDADGRQPGRAQTCKTPLGGAWTACEDGGIAETTFVRQPAERSDWDCGGTQMRCQETQMSWILNPVKRALKVLRIYESWTVISSKMAID